MKCFLIKCIKFCGLLLVISALGLTLPTPPRIVTSQLFGEIKKDSLLQYEKSPRLIIVGGSNACFGFISQMIKDSLNVNPINTAINARLSLQYMLNHTLEFVKKGDVVVVAFEYHAYSRDFDFASEELFHIILDVNKENLKFLSIKQQIGLIPYLPKYIYSKFDPKQYFGFQGMDDKVYLVSSFNKYGDVDTLFVPKKKKNLLPMTFDEPVNLMNIEALKVFEKEVKKRLGTVLVTYPCFQDKSFVNSEKAIENIKAILEKNFTVLGTPERYMMPDSLMFDSQWHLNKEGMKRRTELFIEDYKKNLELLKIRPIYDRTFDETSQEHRNKMKSELTDGCGFSKRSI